MKPLSIMLIFLFLALPLIMGNDAKQDYYNLNRELQKKYADDFQAAVDDAGAYIGRLEAQQSETAVRYQREKQITLDEDMLNVFFANLALKYGIENNPVAIENLKIHMPAMVMFKYDGYTMITLEDILNETNSSEIKPVFWPNKPYTYTLSNGNLIYFTLDDQATVFEKGTNQFYQGSFTELSGLTNLAPLENINAFRNVRQNAITTAIEKDLAGAINRHMKVFKRMDMHIQFTIPRGLNEQSIQDIGFMAFVQGYPLSNGELFNGYAFGGGSVIKRKDYVGTVSNTGKHIAYENGCVPDNVTEIESIFDPEEAVRKGYFIEECFKP